MKSPNIRAVLYFSKCPSEIHLGWVNEFDFQEKADFKSTMRLEETDIRHICKADIEDFIVYLKHMITKVCPKDWLKNLTTGSWLITVWMENIGVVQYLAFAIKGRCLYPCDYVNIELEDDYIHLEDDMLFASKGALYDSYYMYNQNLAKDQMGLGLEIIHATKLGFLNSITYNDKMLKKNLSEKMLKGVGKNVYISNTNGISVRTILDYMRWLENMTNHSMFPKLIEENIKTPMIKFASELENNQILYLTHKCHTSVIKNTHADTNGNEQFNICFMFRFLIVVFCVTIDRKNKKIYNIVLDAKYKNLHNRAVFGSYPLFRTDEGDSRNIKIDFSKFLEDLSDKPTRE